MGVPAHPLAGQKGEGPPIAPEQWKWRCGNRLQDMYFYSPTGKLVRSRTELANVLSSMTDPPRADDFCWRVTGEILNTGVWKKEEATPKKKSKSPAPKSPALESPAPKSPAPRRKSKAVEPEERKKKAKVQVGANGTPDMPSPSIPNGNVQFSQVEPLAIRAPGSVVSKKVTTTSRSKVKARKEKTEAPTSHTFREILTDQSSFKWLYDLGTLNAFLQEAEKLTELSAKEISELRALLLKRNFQVSNITKYPNQVLRVFVRLLNTQGLGEEPPASLGKVELADRCMTFAGR